MTVEDVLLLEKSFHKTNDKLIKQQEKKSIYSPHPMDYQSFYFSWVPSCHSASRQAEKALLSRVFELIYPALEELDIKKEVQEKRNTKGKLKAELGWVSIGHHQYINTLKILPSEPKSKTLVVLHGYGGGIGFFYKVKENFFFYSCKKMF